MRVLMFITLVGILCCKSPQKKDDKSIQIIDENSTVGEDYEDIIRPDGMSDLEFEKFIQEEIKRREEEARRQREAKDKEEERNKEVKPNPFTKAIEDQDNNNSTVITKEDSDPSIVIQLSPVKPAGAIIRFKNAIDSIIAKRKERIERAKREEKEREDKDPTINQPKPTIKTKGYMSDIDLQELYKRYGRNGVVVMQSPGPYRVGLAGMEDKRLFETVQFTIKKKSRLKSYNTINGPGKDYNLYRSPVTDSRFYFLSDRVNTLFKTNEKDFTSKLPRSVLKKVKGQKNDPSGTGFLEIVTVEAANNKEGRLVFYNSTFTNIKDLHSGNKLGYTLYQNESKLNIIYSAEGDLHRAQSTDGINFELIYPMLSVNSELYTDRDPSVSPDGKILAFASSRNMESNIRGTQLFISTRESIQSEWNDPVCVPYAMNSLNELFPVIFQYKDRYFVFVRVFDNADQGEYKETIHSIEIREGIVFPMVPVSDQSDIPYKYFAVNNGDIFGSYPVNDYDLFQLEFSKIEKVHVNINSKIYK